MSKPKLICANCGAEMNHHADKVEVSVEEPIYDSIYGGVLKEVHTCPNCGRCDLIAAQSTLK